MGRSAACWEGHCLSESECKKPSPPGQVPSWPRHTQVIIEPVFEDIWAPARSSWSTVRGGHAPEVGARRWLEPGLLALKPGGCPARGPLPRPARGWGLGVCWRAGAGGSQDSEGMTGRGRGCRRPCGGQTPTWGFGTARVGPSQVTGCPVFADTPRAEIVMRPGGERIASQGGRGEVVFHGRTEVSVALHAEDREPELGAGVEGAQGEGLSRVPTAQRDQLDTWAWGHGGQHCTAPGC